MPGDMPADAGASYKPSGTHPTLFPREAAPSGSSGPGGTVAIDDIDSLVDSDDPAEIAASLEDRTAMGFSLLRVVGKGGMGEVWEGVQRRLRRIVAVKRLRLGAGAVPFTESNTHLRSFRGEALTAALLDHPNIVPVYDLGFDDDGWPLLAMKFVRGQNWEEILKRDFESMAPEEYVARHVPILAQLSQAVAFAHSRGVIHRDLKPSQVMIGEYGEVLLMDWGLALMVCDPPTVNGEPPPPRTYPSIHSASNPAGTPGYMAPEQTSSSPAGIGEWTDVYLLGGTLYKILTGRMPHDAATSQQAFALACAGSFVPIEEAGAGRHLPHELVSLATEALDREPARRIPTAKHFLDRVQDFLTGATRRRESAAIINEIAASPQLDHTTDYPVLTEALEKVGQADRLWPDNPQVPTQRARLVERYAKAALAHGDLTLARAQANALPGGGARDSLLSRVEAEQARLARQRSLVRQLTVAAFVLLAGIVVIGTISSSRLGEAAERLRGQLAMTEEARAAEVAARADAQAEADYSTLLLANALVDQQRGEEAIGLLERIPEAKRTWEWGLVLTRALSDLVTIPLEYLSLSPSRTRALAYRRSDDSLVVAHAASGGVIARLRGGFLDRPVVSWSDDESLVASVSSGSKSAQVHETGSGRRVLEVDESAEIRSLAIAPDNQMLALGTADGAVRLVPIDRDGKSRDLAPHQSRVDAVLFAHDPGVLVSVSSGGVRMESLATGRVLAAQAMLDGSGYRAESSPDRRFIAICSRREDACVLDTVSGEFHALGAEVADFEFARGGRTLLAAVRADGSFIRTWDTATWQEKSFPRFTRDARRALAELAALDADEVSRIQLGHDESTVMARYSFAYATFPYPSMLTGERPRTLLARNDIQVELMPDAPSAWFIERDGETHVRQLHRQYVGKTLNGRTPGMGLDTSYYTMIRRGRVESRDTATGRLICVAAEGFNWYRGTRPSPDGTETIAFGRRGTGFTVEKSSRATSEVTATYQWEDEPHDFSGSPDARRLFLIPSDRKCLQLWSLDDGTKVGEFPAPSGHAFITAAFSPDSTQLAVVTDRGTATILDGTTAGAVMPCTPAPAKVRRLAWAPDGSVVAASLEDGGIVCWDSRTGRISQSMRMPTHPAYMLWFSPDGKLLLAQPEMGAGVLWDWREEQQRAVLGLAGFLVDNVRFLPGGDRLVAWAGGECRVWDTRSGREVFSTDRDFGTISADGRRVVLREADARWTIVEVIPWKTADLPGNEGMPWRERVALWVRERHRKWYVNAPADRIPEAMELLRVEGWRRIDDPRDRIPSFLADACSDVTQRGGSVEAQKLLLNTLARLWGSRPRNAAFPDTIHMLPSMATFLRECPTAAEEPAAHMFVGEAARRLAEVSRRGSARPVEDGDLVRLEAGILTARILNNRGDAEAALTLARRDAAMRMVFRRDTRPARELLQSLEGSMPEPPSPDMIVPATLVPALVAGRLGDQPTEAARNEAWRLWHEALADYLEAESPGVDWTALEQAARAHPSLGEPLDSASSFASVFPDLEAQLQRCLFDGMTLAERQEALGRQFDELYAARVR